MDYQKEFFEACEVRDFDKVRKILIEHKDKIDIEAKNEIDIEVKNKREEFTALHFASYYGHPEIVELLLENGADIEGKDNYENTPLINATWYGNLKVVKLLLENGADIEAKNIKGITPLINTCLIGHYKITKLLIEQGADIEAKSNDGRSFIDFIKNKEKDEIEDFIQDIKSRKMIF